MQSEFHDEVACLILDVGLPGMNGLELQKSLASSDRSIRIVFVTAREDDYGQMQRQALAAGAVAFLHKPLGDQALLRAVQSSLEQEN